VIALQGPSARQVLASLVDIDISAGSVPHMGVAVGHICGVPMRLFRVSFTGELGFEVNVPADFGAAVWEAVWAAGQAHGITPYGTEAMHVLRAEKGYIIVGQDTDGTVTPDDAGLSWAIGRNKIDFVGKRSLQRPAMQAADRRQLVGLLTEDPERVLEEGSQVLAQADAASPVRPLGHVTSSYHSVALGRSIAMALIAGGRSRMGQTLYVPLEAGGVAPVQVASPVFYDPKGLTFPFGTHIAVVEVDPATGDIVIDRFLAVDDCGPLINPLLARGQVHGGIAQGLGQALLEGARYDSDGSLASRDWTTYAFPRAQHIPRVETEHTVTPSPLTPLGVKGIGEAGAIGAPPAIVNAVLDALAPLGVTHLDMPLHPEQVRTAIRQAATRGSAPGGAR